jgi:hypothetical protein
MHAAAFSLRSCDDDDGMRAHALARTCRTTHAQVFARAAYASSALLSALPRAQTEGSQRGMRMRNHAISYGVIGVLCTLCMCRPVSAPGA